MDLHPRQLLVILEKPLGLATKFIFSLADSNSGSSDGGSQQGHYKPSPLNHSPMTSGPLIPAFLLLLVAFLLATRSPIKVWLTKTDNLPTLASIFSFSRKKVDPSLPRVAESVSVWAKQQSGFYYCQGGALFGDRPGKIMTQVDALGSGYRPADGTYCANTQPVVASAEDSSLGSQPPFQPEDDSAGVEEASISSPSDQQAAPIPASAVSVWAIKPYGFYYCRGDAMFGTGPGQLMAQAEARAAGMEPSLTACSGTQSNIASAGPSPGAQQPGSASAIPQIAEPSRPPSNQPPEQSNADEHIGVWVKKEFGFYYCRDDVLFGNRPGQLMSQTQALAAGYQPSDGRCSNEKQPRKVAQTLPPRTFSARK